MEDEAEIYDGVRAQFPLSFGKQSKAQAPLESVHSATRRHGPGPGPASASPSPSLPSATAAVAAAGGGGKSGGLPSLSSSSRAWLEGLRAGNPRPGPDAGTGSRGGGGDGEGGGRAMIGPPRPPPGLISSDEGGGEEEDDDDDDDDGVMVGPPPPPPGNLGDGGDDDEEEEEEAMIGPPRPPIVDSEDEEEEEEENRYRLPLSNEIVLKGHTKVSTSLFPVPLFATFLVLSNLARRFTSGDSLFDASMLSNHIVIVCDSSNVLPISQQLGIH